jgi:hypothetical protein
MMLDAVPSTPGHARCGALFSHCSNWLPTGSVRPTTFTCVDAKLLPSCPLAQASSRRSHWLGLSQLEQDSSNRWCYGDKLLAVVSPRGHDRLAGQQWRGQ